MATVKIMRAFICSFVRRSLATTATPCLVCCHHAGGFVFYAFAIDTGTIRTRAKCDGKNANNY